MEKQSSGENLSPTLQLCNDKFSMYFVPQEREAYDNILKTWPKFPPLETWFVVSINDRVIVRFMRTGKKDVFLSKSMYELDDEFDGGEETQDRFYAGTLKSLVEAFLKKWLKILVDDDKHGNTVDVNLTLKVKNITQ